MLGRQSLGEQIWHGETNPATLNFHALLPHGSRHVAASRARLQQ